MFYSSHRQVNKGEPIKYSHHANYENIEGLEANQKSSTEKQQWNSVVKSYLTNQTTSLKNINMWVNINPFSKYIYLYMYICNYICELCQIITIFIWQITYQLFFLYSQAEYVDYAKPVVYLIWSFHELIIHNCLSLDGMDMTQIKFTTQNVILTTC